MTLVKKLDLHLKEIPDELCCSQTVYINVGELNFYTNDFEEIPQNIQFTALTFLDISQNDLVEFPSLQCPNLKILNISYNNITVLPESITKLSLIRNFDVSNNNITSLPKPISLLTCLTFLNLKGNPITTAPPNFSIMKIKKLNVSNTKTFVFEPLTSLRELVYSDVHSDVLFDDFSVLSNLEKLDLSNNMFKSINNIPKTLNILDVSHNELTTLEISEKLVIADFSRNQINNLPAHLAMTKLEFLSLAFNKLSTIDVDFQMLGSLSHLDLSFNRLSTLSSSLSSLTNLNSLYLTGNKLISLPSELANLSKLKVLHLSNNRFKVLPTFITSYPLLSKLYISSNPLTTLPVLTPFSTLNTLDASNCFLTTISTIVNLPNLEQLNVSNNYLSRYHAFEGCSKLAFVDVSFNYMCKVIDTESFKYLKFFDVSYNIVSTVPNQLFDRVTLHNNCDNIGLYNFLPRFASSIRHKQRPITVSTSQMCADREEMQDTVFCISHFAAPNYYLLAAVDGHSGSDVSHMFSSRYPQILYDIFEENQDLGIEECLKQSFDVIQNSSVSKLKDGAVVTVLFITSDTIYTAQCGDCRGIYITSKGVQQLALEHKTTDPSEQKRIRDAGGYVSADNRVNGLLVARSVGDNKFKPIITHEPVITVTPRVEDEEFIVVATDGLWDEVSNDMVYQVLHQNRKNISTSQLAAMLRDTSFVSCIANQHADNIGIAMCKL
ncbi:Leucine-rich repeat containing protein [Entamoeba marina]